MPLVRPPHIGEIYRRQKQRSFHGIVPNGGVESGSEAVTGGNPELRKLSGDLESTVDKLRNLLVHRQQRESSSTDSRNSSAELPQTLSVQAR